LAALALGLAVSTAPLSAHAPPPPLPDYTQLPQVKAELDKDVANAPSDDERMKRNIHRGQVLANYRDPTDAKASFELALAIARKPYAEIPQTVQARQNLRTALNALGTFETARDHDAALACFREGLQIARGVAAVDPQADSPKRDLVWSLFLLGDHERIYEKDDAGALAAFREELSISHAMMDRYPKTNGTRYFWHGQMAFALNQLASVPGSGVSYDDAYKETVLRAADMKANGFADPPYID